MPTLLLIAYPSPRNRKILLRLNSAYDILNAFIIIPIVRSSLSFALRSLNPSVQGMALLYNEIGVTFIASILSVVLLTAIVPPLARNIGPAQAAWSNLTDVRQRLTSSIVRNILPVKLSAYTTILGEKIETFRVNELVAYRKFWIQMGRVRRASQLHSSQPANSVFGPRSLSCTSASLQCELSHSLMACRTNWGTNAVSLITLGACTSESSRSFAVH